MNVLLPPSPLLVPFVRRTCAMWLSLRAVAIVGTVQLMKVMADLEGVPMAPLDLGTMLLGAPVALLTCAWSIADLARRGELVLLSNLGRSPLGLAAGALLVCALLELVWQAALAIL